MPELQGFRWRQKYVSQLGCIKACLDYLGVEVSFPWLYGGTAHAFVVNIGQGLDPSGPTCWPWQRTFELTPNLGFRVSGFSVEKNAAGDSFPDKQREAWDFVRASIDKNLPCFGWELHGWVPDYYVIYGYDDEGYLYSGWLEGHVAWQKLGDQDVKVLQVYSVEACEPGDDAAVVDAAIRTALDFAARPHEWMAPPGYGFGPAAFDVWARDLESGAAVRDGHSYNAEVWRECRDMAAQFLAEVERRLPGRYGSALGEAGRCYATIRDTLKTALDAHPFRRDTWDDKLKLESPEAAALIRQAGEAEREALDFLRQAASHAS